MPPDTCYDLWIKYVVWCCSFLVPTDHRYISHTQEKKMEFLIRIFEDCSLFEGGSGMSKLFADAKDLQEGPGGMAFDKISNDMDTIPMCDDLFAGFPCQDVSKLNPGSSKNRQVIRDQALRTGSVFNYILAYAEKAQQKPDASPYLAMILENVLGLLERPPGCHPETQKPWRSNLEYCAFACRKSGYSY